MEMAKEKKFWRDYDAGRKLIAILENNIGKEFIIFDTETTGLSPSMHHVIQLSAIKCVIDEEMQFHEIDRFDTYINPGYKLSKEIIKITGITDELLAKYADENTQWDKIYRFFGDNSLVCGHNVTFDNGMMKAMYERHGAEWNPVAMDTMRMAQELHLKNEVGNHKLGTLAEHFGLDYGLTFHNSMDDIIATMRLLRLFVEEYLEKRTELESNPEQHAKQTKIKSCWTWTSPFIPKGSKSGPLQRLYVRVAYEDRVIYMNQRRPYDWGEKDAGTLEVLDMQDIESQVLKLYGCKDLDELSKVRESKYAR